MTSRSRSGIALSILAPSMSHPSPIERRVPGCEFDSPQVPALTSVSAWLYPLSPPPLPVHGLPCAPLSGGWQQAQLTRPLEAGERTSAEVFKSWTSLGLTWDL